jgi:hypothetical protein
VWFLAGMSVGVSPPLYALTESQKFSSESGAASAGWTGADNRNASYGTNFGFSNTNNIGAPNTVGEAGGVFPRRVSPHAFYADTSIGTLTLATRLEATGKIVFYQDNLDGGMKIGWFNTDDLTQPLPAFGGASIAEQNRFQATLLLNNHTGTDGTLVRGAPGPTTMPFSLVWDPGTRIFTVNIGNLTNQTFYLTDAQLAIGSTFNAFGIGTNYAGTNNPNLQGRLFVDDLVYTSGDTTTPLVRINRYTGAARIVGSGGSAPIQIDGYTLGSNPANPPLENVLLPGNWNSITDQEGGGWSEVPPPPPGTQQLGEANASASKTISPGSRINLGNIYDVASADRDLSFSYNLAGDNVVRPGNVVFDGGLSLLVNKQSGAISILNKEGLDFSVDGYVIQSDAGVLNATTWNSLQEQSVNGWESIASSDSGELSEVNLVGATTMLQNTGRLELGAAYAGGLAGAQELTFTFSLAGGQEVLVGEVLYVTSLTGDYNSDGKVDAADYTVWRDTLTSATDLRADGNGNLVVDAGDYLEWKNNFGAAQGAGSGGQAAIPEPATGLLLLFAGSAVSLLRVGRRY